MKKSIGSEIVSYDVTDEGLTIKFDAGDLCNPIDDIYYTSEVQMICDSEESEGWPVHKKDLSEGCH